MWTGLQTLVGTVIANLAIRAIALATLDIRPEFAPLQSPGPTIVLTSAGVLAGLVVFAIVGTFTDEPLRPFRIIASAALLLSLLPDLWLLTAAAGPAFPGATVSGVVTLMVQHVTAAAILIGLLTVGAKGTRLAA